ncbi:ATP-binding cassette domain-containing protein [Streptomyces zhihengii]
MIRFENVSFRYPGGDPVFENLSFEVRLGRSLAVVGLNGAGKSTLVRLLTGVLRPDAGSITCDGEPLGPPEERPAPPSPSSGSTSSAIPRRWTRTSP